MNTPEAPICVMHLSERPLIRPPGTASRLQVLHGRLAEAWRELFLAPNKCKA